MVMRGPSRKKCRVAVARGDYGDPRVAVLETMIPESAGRWYPAFGVRGCFHTLGTPQVNRLDIDFHQTYGLRSGEEKREECVSLFQGQRAYLPFPVGLFAA